MTHGCIGCKGACVIGGAGSCCSHVKQTRPSKLTCPLPACEAIEISQARDPAYVMSTPPNYGRSTHPWRLATEDAGAGAHDCCAICWASMQHVPRLKELSSLPSLCASQGIVSEVLKCLPTALFQIREMLIWSTGVRNRK
eukprot:scaffold139480_cov22-Tisochrysis_lutea.AAC.1